MAKIGEKSLIQLTKRMVPATKDKSDVIDLTSTAEALPKEQEDADEEMPDAENKPVTGKKRKKNRSRNRSKKQKNEGNQKGKAKHSGAPLPPLPPPSDEMTLPNLKDVLLRRISILWYIPRGTATKIRDAFN